MKKIIIVLSLLTLTTCAVAKLKPEATLVNLADVEYRFCREIFKLR